MEWQPPVVYSAGKDQRTDFSNMEILKDPLRLKLNSKIQNGSQRWLMHLLEISL